MMAFETRIAMMKPVFRDDAMIDDLMRRWPSTIGVVLRHGMLCVGCPIASFHTVSDAAREHGIGVKLLRHDLKAAINMATASLD
jgi:hybrid cluster-associated redox disulfide protein